MAPGEKRLVWLHGQIRTPPFSEEARIEAGYLLGRLQQGESLGKWEALLHEQHEKGSS